MKFIIPDDPNSVEPAIPPESKMLCELLERNGVAQWIVDKACILLEVAIEKYLAQPPASEPPSEPGWYWLKTGKIKWRMVLLQDEDEHGLWVYPLGAGGNEYPLHELTGGQWSGLIKEPS